MKVTLPGLLFVVFLVLKLTGVIAWSWWAVTAPLWVPVAAALVFVVLCVLAEVTTSTWKNRP